MVSTAQRLRIHYIDREINERLENLPGEQPPYTMHFNQSEEFFLKLSESFAVPPLPIHHDVTVDTPDAAYIEALRELIGRLTPLIPDIFRGLTYSFDPTQIFKPRFFAIYRMNDSRYLYLLELDLMYRAQEAEVIKKGTNDITPRYATRNLHLEAIFIPLKDVTEENGRVQAMDIYQTLSETWIGERGRGYMLHGIWMDDDLTKFFSKLFIPDGRKSYPYYPFICRYKSICNAVLPPSPQGKKRFLAYLHKAIQFLEPVIPEIQSELKGSSFSDDLPVFQKLKAAVPDSWGDFLQSLKIEAYLNHQEMKEYRVEI